MFKCLKCGHLFEDGEQKTWTEDWGETCNGCPICNHDYEEVTQCEICGTYHFEDELYSGVCEDCISDYKYDIDTCFKIGEEDKQKVKINSFLLQMFGGVEEVEAYLYQVLKKERNVDCTPFIAADKSWFAERLGEVLKNEIK